MKVLSTLAAAVVLVGSIAATAPAQAEPGGCLKYGAVGAVGGHLAHHGVLGAAGGCAAGMYKRHQYRKQQRAIAHQGDVNSATSTVATPAAPATPAE